MSGDAAAAPGAVANEVAARYDAILSLACGVGVGFVSEKFPSIRVLPALDTSFYGANTEEISRAIAAAFR